MSKGVVGGEVGGLHLFVEVGFCSASEGGGWGRVVGLTGREEGVGRRSRRRSRRPEAVTLLSKKEQCACR